MPAFLAVADEQADNEDALNDEAAIRPRLVDWSHNTPILSGARLRAINKTAKTAQTAKTAGVALKIAGKSASDGLRRNSRAKAPSAITPAGPIVPATRVQERSIATIRALALVSGADSVGA